MNDIEKAWQRVCMWIGCTPKEEIDTHRDYKTIKQALEKQIPKKPIYHGEQFATHYTCPVCGRLYWEESYIGKYCDSCGQNLEV